MSNSIKISSLQSYGSLLEALMDITGLSRQQVKKFYTKPSKLNAKVSQGKELTVPLDLINYLRINPEYSGAPISKLFEDENFLVLEKPAGVHMHPLSYSDTNNLVSYIIKLNPQLESVNSKNWDRGFIYRLDQETSGVVYYAKRTDIYNHMREHFKEVAQSKSYLAIVMGKVEAPHKLTHTYYQKKGANKVEISPAGGLQSVSIDVIPLKYDSDKDWSLVRVELNEGKRHQIRSQLAFAGHPIVGDELYGGPAGPRVFLHCEQYILDFQGKKYQQKSSPDQLLQHFSDSN